MTDAARHRLIVAIALLEAALVVVLLYRVLSL